MLKQIFKELKIGALIVTYNRKELLEECIHAVQKQNIHSFSIYIFDNASIDGTKEMVKSIMCSDARIHYLNLGKNLGGAGGFSLGIKYLMQKGYNRFWIMDDDTIPNENALEELLKADCILDGQYGFLSSYVQWINGKYCLMNSPKISDLWIADLEYMKLGLISLQRATFVSLLLNSDTIIAFGLPIKEFFIWGDDWEYTGRISKGRKSFLVTSSTVVHKTAANVGSDISNDNNSRIERYFYSFRNEFYISKKDGILSVVCYFYRVIGTFKAILRNNIDKKFKRIFAVIRGVIYGIFFHPSIEYYDDTYEN